MTAQAKSRKGLIFVITLCVLLVLALLVGVPMLEKRIAARFVSEWQSISIMKYQIEEPRASLFKRSFATGKLSYTVPPMDGLPEYSVSCAHTETAGMDWGTLLGYYPEISSAASTIAEGCQVSIDGAPMASIKEMSASNVSYRYKELIGFSKNFDVAANKTSLSNEAFLAALAAMKDFTFSNLTIKGLDINYVAFSFTIPHAEVNDLVYLHGHGKALAKDMKFMMLGQKLFSLDEMSVDRLDWSFAIGFFKKLSANPMMANTSVKEAYAIYAEYPFELRNFKLKGLEVNGSKLLSGSNENILTGKEIGLNLSMNKNAAAGFTVDGLNLNLAALKKIPAVQEALAFYNKPLQLGSTFELTIENIVEPSAINFSASLDEKNLGGAKAAASLGLLDPKLSFDGDNIGVKTAEFVMTDTGILDIVWRIAAGSRSTPEAMKAEALKDMDEALAKSTSPISAKARQAMRDFLEKGGQVNMKINLPKLTSFDDLTESFKSEMPQGVEVDWAPLKK